MNAAIWIPIIGGLILFAVIRAGVRAPGVSLQNRMAALGPLAGKTIAEIAEAVRTQPSSVSTNAAGTLAQWQASGYHIAMQFGPDGKFVRITHQYSATGIRQR